MDTQIIPYGYLRDVQFDESFVEVNYSTKNDVCGLIFAEITTSRRVRHVIFVTIFRALFLAPGSFVSLTDIRFREFQLFRCIYEKRGNDVASRVSRCNFLLCVSPPSIAIVEQTRSVSSETQASLSNILYLLDSLSCVRYRDRYYYAGHYSGFILPRGEIRLKFAFGKGRQELIHF